MKDPVKDPLDEIFADSTGGGSRDPLDEVFNDPPQKGSSSRVNIDQRGSRDNTRVTPQKVDRNPHAGEGMLDSVLSGLTVGAHPVIMGVGSMLGDVLQHGLNAHPGDSFSEGRKATLDRQEQAARQYGAFQQGAEALGTGASLAAEAPVRAALGLREAIEGARAGSGIARVGKAATKGAVTGAAVGGIGGADNLKEGATKMAVGGLLGGLLSGGTSAVSEAAPAIKRAANHLTRSTDEAAAEGANRNILRGLSDDQIMPEDLPERGRAANAAGNTRGNVSHLGDRSLDQQTYLATSSNSPESAELARGIRGAQRSENEILQHGVTEMSGIPETAAAEPEAMKRSLTNRRQALGAVDYPKAYDAPDVSDPRVVNAIKGDRDLTGVLDEVVDQMNREEEAAAIKYGREPRQIAHPLAPAKGNALAGIDVARLRRDFPDQVEGILAELQSRPTEAPSISVKMLDRMKQGADDIIERRASSDRPMTARDARILQDKVRSILGFVDEAHPDYASTRSGQSALFGQENAAEQGATALDRSGGEITNDLSGLTRPNEQDAYLATATDDLRKGIKGARRNNNAQLKLDSPKVEEQLDALYGPGGRQRLQPSVDQARRVNEVQQHALGGSPTEARQASRAQSSNEAAQDIAHLAVNPNRAAYNIPGKKLDERTRKIQTAIYREMAKRLGIGVNDPRLIDLADELVQARSQLPFKSGTPANSPTAIRAGGVLAGYLGQRTGH